MTDRTPVAKAADLLRERAGFRRDPALQGRLNRCLSDAADADGREINDYVDNLAADDHALQRLVDRVTIQESSFFRDEAQFIAFTSHLLPRLPATTLWSAGCANGQEPWSLAIALDENERTDCRILASDISTTALARARRGWYAERELRGLSPQRRERYFRPSDGGFEVVPSLRRLVNFEHHNLAADAAPVTAGACVVAFCRNVLIYLTDEEIKGVLDRVATAVGPGGHLFLGYSESLWRLPSRFALRRLGDTFVYQVASRTPVAVAPPAKPAPAPVARVVTPVRPPHPRRTPLEQAPLPDADHYLERGQTATAARDLQGAVVAFRKAAYLRPDDAGIALHLAFALESLGDVDGARPWFRRALETMSGADATVEVFEGWSTRELRSVLERKLTTMDGGR